VRTDAKPPISHSPWPVALPKPRLSRQSLDRRLQIRTRNFAACLVLSASTRCWRRLNDFRESLEMTGMHSAAPRSNPVIDCAPAWPNRIGYQCKRSANNRVDYEQRSSFGASPVIEISNTTKALIATQKSVIRRANPPHHERKYANQNDFRSRLNRQE
jgi:hypothetical protein